MNDINTDQFFMRIALKEAKIAYDKGEVPVGAVIVARNQIISKAHNQTQMLNDVTAHAEILAITAASQSYGSKYLTDCTLYVTLEPCVMCAGAIKWSQIGRLVYSADDEKHGFMKYGKSLLHPTTKVELGLFQEESVELMRSFFTSLRNNKA